MSNLEGSMVNEKENASLHQSQSTNLNLRGKTIHLNQNEQDNKNQNQKELFKLKNTLSTTNRSRTPQYVEDEFNRDNDEIEEVAHEENANESE